MPGFIKDASLLAETSRTDDLLDFSNEISNLEDIIEEISQPSILGLVGRFGSGKSTMLYQLKKKKNAFWMDFDAWMYPERKNLWEGFILDFAEQFGAKEKEKTRKKVDGESNKDARQFVKTVSKAAYLIPGLNLAAPLIEKIISDGAYFLDESPITRVYQLQVILNTLVKQVKGDIYIVIEDIDRSQDAGVFFLETLKQFLRNLDVNKKIIVFVPIGTENFANYRKEYSKCLDYIEEFYPNNGLENFIQTVVKDIAVEETTHQIAVKQIALFFEQLAMKYDGEVTIREIKRILRQANERYVAMRKKGFEADWRIVVAIESTRIIFNEIGESFFRNFKRDRTIPSGKPWSILLMLIFYKNANWEVANSHHNSWKLVEDTEKVLPIESTDMFRSERVTYKLSYKYFQHY